MKISFKRSRVIKVTVVALLLVVAVPFFISKPKGYDAKRHLDSALKAVSNGRLVVKTIVPVPKY